MKKSEIRDVTIRSVGDVTNISTADTAKSGLKEKAPMVPAPAKSGNPGEAKTELAEINQPTNPSLDGLPVPDGPGTSAHDQPKIGAPGDASSVQTSAAGRSVAFPPGADRTSAGGVKSTDTFAQITGSKVSFPPASDNSAMPKDVKSFAPDGKDW